MKKFICLALSILMLMSLLPISAFAADNYSYRIKNGVMTISGSGTIQNNAFRDRKDFHTVIIQEGITGIDPFAFCTCRIERITFPSSLKSISNYAFYCNDYFSEVEIPTTVSYIGPLAFYDCKNLTATLHRTEESSIGFDAFFQAKKLIVKVPKNWNGDRGSLGASSSEYVTDIDSLKDGYYIIHSAVDPNYCLDISGGLNAKNEGDNLHLLPVDTSTANIFEIKKDGDAYKITAAHSGMVLDIEAYSRAEGANIYQWTDYGTTNQRWTCERTFGENCYFIHSVQDSGTGWMDAAGCINGAMPQYDGSTNVYSWSYTGNPNQMWIFEKVNYTPTGFTLSEGNTWIIFAGAVVILGGITAIVINNKKKKVKPVLAESEITVAENTEKTEE